MIIGCAARLRGRPSSLKGRFALAARRPPAALDPGASAAPNGKVTAGRLCLAAPDARRPTRKSAKRSLYGLRGLPVGCWAWRKPSSKNVAVECVARRTLSMAGVYWLGPSSKVR
jgi:hypothetical protein